MEKDVESYLVRKVRAAGGTALKLVSPGFAGVPDRLILMPGGRALFAETKDRDKRPRKRQRFVHDRLRGLGFQVFTPDTREAVDKMMEEVAGDGVQAP